MSREKNIWWIDCVLSISTHQACKHVLFRVVLYQKSTQCDVIRSYSNDPKHNRKRVLLVYGRHIILDF